MGLNALHSAAESSYTLPDHFAEAVSAELDLAGLAPVGKSGVIQKIVSRFLLPKPRGVNATGSLVRLSFIRLGPVDEIVGPKTCFDSRALVVVF